MLKSFEIQLACRNGDGLLTAAELKAGQWYAEPVELHATTTMTKTKHATGILYHIFRLLSARSREGRPQRHPW